MNTFLGLRLLRPLRVAEADPAAPADPAVVVGAVLQRPRRPDPRPPRRRSSSYQGTI